MATIPNPITWVASAVVTAAQLNTNIRDAINFILGAGTNPHPFVYAYQSVAQTLTAGTIATVTLGAEVEDSDAMHGTTGTITVVTPGLYHVQGQVCFPSTSSGHDGVNITVNGSGTASLLSDVPFTSGAHHVQVSGFLRFVAGDTFVMQAFSTTGGALVAGQLQTFLQARWVRE